MTGCQQPDSIPPPPHGAQMAPSGGGGRWFTTGCQEPINMMRMQPSQADRLATAPGKMMRLTQCRRSGGLHAANVGDICWRQPLVGHMWEYVGGYGRPWWRIIIRTYVGVKVLLLLGVFKRPQRAIKRLRIAENRCGGSPLSNRLNEILKTAI